MIPSRVESIIGIKEPDLVKLDFNERSKYMYGNSFIHSKDSHITPIGQFETIKLADLKKLVGNNNEYKSSCLFEVKEGIDIGVLQSTLKSSDKAMVQVASNFNCLEVPSRHFLPTRGNLITDAHTDETQGPAACFGPLAAYLYRAHFYNKQINLLRYATDYFGTPVNGKLTLDGSEKSISNESIDDISNLIEIGLHRNAVIIFGRDEHGLQYELDEPYPIVDQVFSASINLKDYGKKTTNDKLININRTLLRATYESAYLAAIYCKRKVLYLTLVGGGSFKNPISLILQEIARAHQIWANHSNSKLKKVVLCIYNEDTNIPNDISKLILS